MANNWDDLADSWDSPETKLYAQKAFDSWQQTVGSQFGSLENSKIMDFGCGTGLLSEKFAALGAQVIAIDNSDEMVATLNSKIEKRGISNITPLATAINASSIKDHAPLLGEFNIILASSVCSFLPDYLSTLQDLSSLLKPGGLFTQWDWQDDMPEKRIRKAFTSAGRREVSINRAFDFAMGDESLGVIMGTAIRR